MRVENQERAESSVGDGVEGTGGEGGDGQRNETNADESVFMSIPSYGVSFRDAGLSRTSQKTSGSYHAKEKCEEREQGRSLQLACQSSFCMPI